jgi:hypothetical protein
MLSWGGPRGDRQHGRAAGRTLLGADDGCYLCRHFLKRRRQTFDLRYGRGHFRPITRDKIFPIVRYGVQVGDGAFAQSQAAGGCQINTRCQVVLQTSDAARLMSFVEQERIQIQFDRMNRRQSIGRARERVTTPPEFQQVMRGYLIFGRMQVRQDKFCDLLLLYPSCAYRANSH